LFEYETVKLPLKPSDVEYDAVHGVIAELVYTWLTGQTTVVTDVALVISKVSLSLLPSWFESPG
jgi:hypothetical protein